MLNCRCFLAHESGAEKVAKQGYFLEGISNGVTYHFELTKRTYFMLRREKTCGCKSEREYWADYI